MEEVRTRELAELLEGDAEENIALAGRLLKGAQQKGYRIPLTPVG